VNSPVIPDNKNALPGCFSLFIARSPK